MPLPSTASSAPRSWFDSPGLVAVLLVVIAFVVGANALRAPFVFDDHPSIVDNATIRQLLPPTWLVPPATAGETVSGRPLLNFTFALNYAGGRLQVTGYHVVNVLIHAVTAFALWGLLRRVPPLGGSAVALVVALLWLVHPLTTAAVSYIVQRAESLAAFLAVLSLLAFAHSASSGVRAVGWRVLSVVLCLLAFATKESVAALPLIVFLYDRALVSGDVRTAWRAHRGYHLAMAACWLLLAWLVLSNGARGGSAGFGGPIESLAYLRTQAVALLVYLRLAAAPVGQVFDYGVAVAPLTPTVVAAGAVILGLLVATGIALWRNRTLGFAGAVFFLLLAPSSSVLPVATQTMAEHRFYLPLVIPLALVVGWLGRLLAKRRAIGIVLTILGVAVLGVLTVRRNEVYRTPERLWADTVAKRPDNPRAHYNLGRAQWDTGRRDEAKREFEQTLVLQPNHAFAQFELGKIALLADQLPEARTRFAAALAADPHFASARVNLGAVLIRQGNRDEAIAEFRAALADDPSAADIRVELAAQLIAKGEVTEAETLVREALGLAPELAEAHFRLGLLLARKGDNEGALAAFARALALKPDLVAARVAVGNAWSARGDRARAESAYREALRADPSSAEAYYGLGNLQARAEQFGEAMTSYRAALERDPGHIEARTNLANCQLVTGRLTDAIANYETVLRARPGEPTATRNLALAREALAGAR